MNEVGYFYLNNNNQLLVLPMVPLSMWRGYAAARDGSRSVLLSIAVFMVARGGRALTFWREDAPVGRIYKIITSLSSYHLF